MSEFCSESDRAAVVLGAARLDYALKQLCQAALLPTPTSSDDLLDTEKPLGSFGPKIKLLHRLGIISTETAHILDIIRRIRNEFAHEPHNASLNSGSHANRVRELVKCYRNEKEFNRWCKEIASEGKCKGHSAEFRAVLAALVLALEPMIDHTEPLTHGEDVFPIKPFPYSWISKKPVKR